MTPDRAERSADDRSSTPPSWPRLYEFRVRVDSVRRRYGEDIAQRWDDTRERMRARYENAVQAVLGVDSQEPVAIDATPEPSTPDISRALEEWNLLNTPDIRGLEDFFSAPEAAPTVSLPPAAAPAIAARAAAPASAAAAIIPGGSSSRGSSSSSTGDTFFAHLCDVFASVRMVESRVSPGTYEFEHASFVAACREFSLIYDRMGSFLAPAKKDMVSNLDTIAAGIARRGPHQIATIQDAIRYDVSNSLTFKHTKDRKGVSFGILWLVRALRFILQLLSNMGSQRFASSETKACAQDAYARAIKPYHGRLLSMTFGVMVSQVPARRKFIAAMSTRPGEPSATPRGHRRSGSRGGGGGGVVEGAQAVGAGGGEERATPRGHRRTGSGDGLSARGHRRTGSWGSLRSSRGGAPAPAPAPAAAPPPAAAAAAASGGAVDEAKVYREMAKCVAAISPPVEALHSFLVERGLDDPWKA